MSFEQMNTSFSGVHNGLHIMKKKRSLVAKLFMVNIFMCDIIWWKLYLLDFSFQHFIVSLLVYFHSQGVDFFGFFLRFSLNPLDLILRLFFQSCNGVMELLNLTTQVRGLFQWPWWTVRIRDCCFGRIFIIVWWHLKMKKRPEIRKKVKAIQK